MVSASKIADRMPQLPDLQLPDIPIDMDDVTDRLKDLTGAAGNVARQAASTTARRTEKVSGPAMPWAFLGIVGVLIAVVLIMRSRRSSADSET